MSEPSPEKPPHPLRGRKPRSLAEKKIRQAPAYIVWAIRDIISAARFVKKPPIKAIAEKRGINHQYLKTWYNDYCNGKVNLCRADAELAPAKVCNPKVEMARSLSICHQLDQYLNDQLEGCMSILDTMKFEDRRCAFTDLGIAEYVRMKLSNAKLRAATELGFLALTDESSPKKIESAEPEKELKGEVVSTVVSEVERFRSVFQAREGEPHPEVAS